jgi:predicted transposase/invertase (TIGR01784 family)
MQAHSMIGDNFGNDHVNLTNRITLNLCDLHAKQRGKGVAYRELLPSYQITICDFTVFPNFDGFISEFCMRRENGEPLNRSINAIVIELTKLSAVAKKPVAEMSEAEKWAIFFKFADNSKQRELINALAAEKEEIMQAVQILSNISQDEHEAARFRARRKFQQDVESNRIESY